MSVFWQSLLAVFAAVGFYTVLHVVYERICAHMLRQHGDGCDPASEQLIRAACRVRRQYLPGAAITFVELGSGQGQNIAKFLAVRQDIMYLE